METRKKQIRLLFAVLYWVFVFLLEYIYIFSSMFDPKCAVVMNKSIQVSPEQQVSQPKKIDGKTEWCDSKRVNYLNRVYFMFLFTTNNNKKIQ